MGDPGLKKIKKEREDIMESINKTGIWKVDLSIIPMLNF